MFDHLLLSLDHPDDRRTLLPHLRRIARKRSARVTVMQMVPFLGTLMEMAGELSPNAHGDDETAEELIAAMVGTLRSEGYSAEGFTEIGRNALALADPCGFIRLAPRSEAAGADPAGVDV